MNRFLLKHILFITVGLILGSMASLRVAGAATGITYHGRILKPDSTPLTSTNVQFHIQIRSPGAEDCLLYDETQTLDLSLTNGLFVLKIGAGTRVGAGVDGGKSLERIFANRGTLNLPTCAGGAPGTYAAGSSDTRFLNVEFSDSGGPMQTLAVQQINSTPFAIDAKQVGGYGTGQLLRVADGVVATEFSNANWTALWDLITGTSTLYSKADGSNFNPSADVTFNSKKAINLADPTAAQDAATKNYSDTKVGGKTVDVTGVSAVAGNGRTLIWDQATNKWITGAVTDSTKLPLAGGTMLGSISLGGTNSLTNIGHVQIADQGTLYLGKFTTAQETTLLATPLNNTTDRGRSWFNTTTSKMRIWNGTTASDVGADLGYTPVNKAGDTMSGLLVLSADPSVALGAATKQYVDAVTTASAAAYVRIDGTVGLTADWDANGATLGGTRKIAGLADPTVGDGAATKTYVDGKLATKNIATPAGTEDLKSVRWNNTAGNWEYYTPNIGDALTTNPLSQFAATTSAQLAATISDETGTGLSVFGTSPTITTPTLATSFTSPLHIGGTTTTSSITYKTTTAAGTTGADHIFKVGNNGATEAMRILNNGNVGVGINAPVEKLEVNGGIKLGSTVGAAAGTLRWTGTNFQGYDGSAWYNIIPNPPAAGACDTTQTYNATGVNSYTVPSGFATLTVRLWGGGGSGGGTNSGGASSIVSLGITANGGAASVGSTGGIGGTASGGTINTPGSNGGNATVGSGQPSGTGGASPNGGSGGNFVSFNWSSGPAGGVPGGGAGGSTQDLGRNGGGGGGAYAEKTFTPVDISAGTTINDIVVGAGGVGGGTGGNGRISITCSTTGAPPVNNRSILFQDTGAYSASTTFVYDTSGRVGIGTATPTAKLEVSGGAIAGTSFAVANANPLAVDFAGGNTGIAAATSGTNIALSNMVVGGAYTLVIRDGTSRTYDFTNGGAGSQCTTAETRYVPGNGATIVSSHSVYTILYAATGTCYISWVTGF